MSSKQFYPFKDFQSDQIQRSSRKIFTAHYACRNANLNLTPVTGTNLRHPLYCVTAFQIYVCVLKIVLNTNQNTDRIAMTAFIKTCKKVITQYRHNIKMKQVIKLVTLKWKKQRYTS